MLQLPKAGTDKFAARTGAGIDGNQIVGLYLNIRYDNGEMYCITGTSLNFFTMDKTLDLEWDKAVKQFLQSHEIPCTEAVSYTNLDVYKRQALCRAVRSFDGAKGGSMASADYIR